MTILKLAVYDMDGTIVDSSHRYRTQACGTKIDLQYWIDNEHKTLQDSLLPLAFSQYEQDVACPNTYVVIATARIWCDLTEQFVRGCLPYPQAKVARRDRHDTRGGSALKITYLKRLLNLKAFQNVKEIHVYEDNEKYMQDMCQALNATGHFCPSSQGH